jgi:hypothetical protein
VLIRGEKNGVRPRFQSLFLLSSSFGVDCLAPNIDWEFNDTKCFVIKKTSSDKQ